jgi:hypothetical protein
VAAYVCECFAVALWHVMEVDNDGKRSAISMKSFACCSPHLLRAVNYVTAGKEACNVRIVKVNRLR